MPVPPANNASALRTSWQDQLKIYCKNHRLSEPVFNIFTESRGKRTAWSCVVRVQAKEYPAQFWYDGDHLNNAKEDAAEKALKVLCPQTPRGNTSYLGQIYANQGC
ncbi:hypothetical protein BDV38DRAFT_257313 [Aspergillus pseudotamarii]|uniref:DRBM domain-containing protein n=1 Tax=Aspergillus pseudotamarii TaxID=132259 RepID=A0A5N6SG61_ASPPS|nr:uncharacterized protein BDV38DRAFT_257313 [Aspergillus pseudotamarii]KAE8133726.1 hypothetical protein BDV38DRAFT_257313 [Aspergillus pseudotamarii]